MRTNTCTYYKNGFCRVCTKGEDPDARCFAIDPVKSTKYLDVNDQFFRPKEDITTNFVKPKKKGYGNNVKAINYFKEHFPDLVIKRNGEYYIECHYCNTIVPAKRITRDHKIPKSEGGTLEPNNVVPACRICNSAKADIPYDRFISSRRSIYKKGAD